MWGQIEKKCLRITVTHHEAWLAEMMTNGDLKGLKLRSYTEYWCHISTTTCNCHMGACVKNPKFWTLVNEILKLYGSLPIWIISSLSECLYYDNLKFYQKCYYNYNNNMPNSAFKDWISVLIYFRNATINSLRIFLKIIDCKRPLLRWCHHELDSSAIMFN